MYSITALARKASLPRRTVQYWADKGVIQPMNRTPLVFGDDELAIVRILAAIAPAKPAIAYVSEVARICRLAIEEHNEVPHDVAQAFAAARSGKESYLGLQPEVITTSDEYMMWIFGAVGESRLKAAVAEKVRARRNLGLTIVDLEYCFALELETGAALVED